MKTYLLWYVFNTLVSVTGPLPYNQQECEDSLKIFKEVKDYSEHAERLNFKPVCVTTDNPPKQPTDSDLNFTPQQLAILKDYDNRKYGNP